MQYDYAKSPVRIREDDLNWFASVCNQFTQHWETPEELQRMPLVEERLNRALDHFDGYVEIKPSDLLYAVETSKDCLTYQGSWELNPEFAERLDRIKAAAEEAEAYCEKCGPFDANDWVRVVDILDRLHEDKVCEYMKNAKTATQDQLYEIKKTLLRLILTANEVPGWIKDTTYDHYCVCGAYTDSSAALKDYPEDVSYIIIGVDPEDVWDNDDWQKVFRSEAEANKVLSDLHAKGMMSARLLKTYDRFDKDGNLNPDRIEEQVIQGYGLQKYLYRIIVENDVKLSETRSYHVAKNMAAMLKNDGAKNVHIEAYEEKFVKDSELSEPHPIMVFFKKLPLAD